MSFIIADTFQKSLGRLDAQAQALVKQSAFEYQLNPSNPGFKLHRLDKGIDKRFWSIRVNDDLRIIVHQEQDSWMLCYTDHHAPAYAWAERRKIEVHPQTGAAQIVEVREEVREIIRPVIREVEQAPLLFAQHEADYLLALGVPTEWLDAVRLATEDNLCDLEGHLPQEAMERLMDLAAGRPVPRPVAPVGIAPFTHPDARRRFRIVDSQEELRQALDYPWEQWIVFLHPDQGAVVERTFKGPGKVSGAAGTGKSVVALHRAHHLASRHAGSRVLLTTFSKTLAARLAQNADLLMGSGSPTRSRVEVAHIHKVARGIVAGPSAKEVSITSPAAILRMLEEANTRVGNGMFATAFLRSEWDAIVDPWGVRTWQDYKAAPRPGRGTSLGAKQRQMIWTIFEHVLQNLDGKGSQTWSGLCLAAARILDEGGRRPYQHVIADESQDFGPAELRLLRALVPTGANDLFLCGDDGQRIYKGRFSWRGAGLDVRGRSTRLRVNYRTTEQIRGFADLVAGTAHAGVDDESEPRDSISLLFGPKPQIAGQASVDDEIAAIGAALEELRQGGFEPHHIAIFARSEPLLHQRAEPALELCGMSGHLLSDDQPPAAGSVAMGTMHRAKGLEFRAVLVIGCEEGVMPSPQALLDVGDAADRDAAMERERQLLYVACTRARERLMISWTGKGSGLLASVKKVGR